MPSRTSGLRCLCLALGVIGCAALCPAQNDNGRFVTAAYMAIMGRPAILWQQGQNPPGIDLGGWTFWVNDLDNGDPRDTMLVAFMNSDEYRTLKSGFVQNPPSCNEYYTKPPFPSPADSDYNNELFIYMLYWYGLNRCPAAEGYAYWVNGLDAGWSIGGVVSDFLLHADGEFLNGSQWYPGGHKAALDAFLLAVNPAGEPHPSAVWFGDQQGGTDAVNALTYNLYRMDFSNFEGSSELSQVRVIIGPSSGYSGSCSIQYLPGTQQVTMLDNSGNPISGQTATLGQAGQINGPNCALDAGASSMSNPGETMSLFLSVSMYPGGTYNWYGQAWALNQAVMGSLSQVPGTLIVTAVQPPAVVLIAPANGTNSAVPVVLTWQSSPGAANYDVYVGAGNPPPFASNTSATSYAPTNLVVGTTYYWKVVARNSAGSAPASATWSFVAATFDGRRVGTSANGSYWGAAGEQIDVLSGNLNFSLPLIRPQGRGWKALFALSYNSQIWRQSGGTTSKLGRDVGYGFGWMLQAGSITASADGYSYVFRDATGAEYLLDQGTNDNLWTSRQGTYVTFNANNSLLYFPDGTVWTMGAQSAPGEPDAGTRYPTMMEDTNGNYILIYYAQGAGGSGINTSARITQIADSRVQHWGLPWAYPSYAFTYNNDPVPHLTSITCNMSVAERYTLGYTSEALQSPFGPPVGFGTAALLQTVTITGLNISHSFQYGSGAAELTQVTTPGGGKLGWSHQTYSYGGGPNYRAVRTRSMQAASDRPQYSWTLALDAAPTLHATMTDVGAGAQKIWTLRADSGVYLGLVSSYQECSSNPCGTVLLQKDYTWTQNGAGNVYIGSVTTTLSPGQSSAAQTKTEQTLDNYGNIVQSKVYGYSSPNTPTRTYNYTYVTDPNYTSRYIRNRLSLATVTSASGTVQLVSNTYDGNLPCGPNGVQNRMGLELHDDTNYGIGFTYRGNVAVSNTLSGQTWYAYETTGAACRVTDGAGRVTDVAPSGSTSYSLPGVLTPGGNNNLATSISYASSWAVQSLTGPNGATASTNYDDFGRPTNSTVVDGASTSYSYTYYPSNPNTQTATLGTRFQKTTLDGFGRTIMVETGHDSTVVSVVDTEYAPCGCSPLGKVSRVSQPHAPGPAQAWTTYTYDGAGRTLTVTAPDGASVTHYAYSGNDVTVTDPAGHWKAFTTDAFGNLVAVTEPRPGGGNNLYTIYTYNSVNQLVTVSMPRGGYTQTRTFTWSGTDLISATNPENGTVSYQYDGTHRVTVRTDAKGQMTTYTYDAYGRLRDVQHYTLVNGFLTLQPNQTVHYYYDTNPFDGEFSQYAWGRLTAVVFHSANNAMEEFAYMYSYNQAGRVTKQRLRLDHDGQVVLMDLDASYTWDNEGRMTSLTYPRSGMGYGPPPQYTYQYDAMGRLSGMQEMPCLYPDGDHCDGYSTWGGTVATAAYGVAGQITGLTYDGYTETRTYNSLLQLTRMTVPGMMDMEYVYPATQNNGRITQSVDHISGETVQYTYDVLNRLTRAETTSAAWGQAFTYDLFGNLTAKTAVKGNPPTFGQNYDPATNRLASPYYDANGNPGIPPSYEYPYDVENRLMLWGRSYDPRNKWVFTETGNPHTPPYTQNTTCEAYFYGIDGRKLATYTCWYNDQEGGDGTFGYRIKVTGWDTWRNVYLGGKLIRANGVTVVTDRLGSVRANANGERFNYYPYGEERTATADGREKFGGYIRDAGSYPGWPVLDYADRRYYASWSGRFLTPDPSAGVNPANPGSWNKYPYVSGDPVNRYDPSGLLEADPNDPGSPTVSIGPGFLTGYGPEGPYTYVGTTISVTRGVNTQVGGGGGTGSNDYRDKGLMNGYQALYDLWKGANLESRDCQRILSQLWAKNMTTGISDPVTKIKQTAYTILQQGYLFDGASSNTPFTVANFGPPGKNDNPSADGTVGGYFRANPNVLGLSQNTGTRFGSDRRTLKTYLTRRTPYSTKFSTRLPRHLASTGLRTESWASPASVINSNSR